MFIQKSILKIWYPNVEEMNMPISKKIQNTPNHRAFFQYIKEKEKCGGEN